MIYNPEKEFPELIVIQHNQSNKSRRRYLWLSQTLYQSLQQKYSNMRLLPKPNVSAIHAHVYS